MRSFMTVLKFEFMHFFKNKTFVIATLIIMALIVGGLSIPRIMGLFSDGDDESTEFEVNISEKFALLDNNQVITDLDLLQSVFYSGLFEVVDSYDAMVEGIDQGVYTAGYVVEGPTTFIYVVRNNEMMDMGRRNFENALILNYRVAELEARGVDYSSIEDVIYPEVTSDLEVLGKDSAGNYLYTYILVFGLYFVIIMYGQIIATAVASEKSNRTMEVLVTSTKTTNLIFGKVLGGALAGILQFGLIIGTGMLTYKVNASAWDNSLDFIFDIPSNVLFNFAIFGILGYLFYAFIFGALGALVSRTEDVGTSATPITMLFVFVFMISMIGMQNTEGIVLKIASFVPFSSFMAMFVRISMGSVSSIEVAASLILLAGTTFGMGILASKLYRMGTLMYGNPVKITDALRILRSE